jgi:FMN-dependent NADH-azoreductase
MSLGEVWMNNAIRREVQLVLMRMPIVNLSFPARLTLWMPVVKQELLNFPFETHHHGLYC